MKKCVLLLVLLLAMAGVGFAAGKYLAPPKDAPTQSSEQKETFYKLPLGRFTVQVMKPKRALNIRFNMDVFIVGAANFEKMNDGLSRNQMREEVIRHLSNMVETTLWVQETEQQDIDQLQLASTIVQKLKRNYPMVRKAEIFDFATSRQER